jgi:hypothetical protein
VIDNMHVKLASSAPAFEGIYEGFEIEITSSASTIDDWYVRLRPQPVWVHLCNAL